jgi:hypothetical protein
VARPVDHDDLGVVAGGFRDAVGAARLEPPLQHGPADHQFDRQFTLRAALRIGPGVDERCAVDGRLQRLLGRWGRKGPPRGPLQAVTTAESAR